MADLPETSEFSEGVTQIETNEPVVGGPTGIANRALIQLGSRTLWLRDQINALLQLLGDDYALKNGDYSTLRARATTKDDVGLSNLENYPGTDAVNDASLTKYAFAAGVKAAYDKALEAIAGLDAKADIAGDHAGLRARATTKDDVGLSNVPNWPATSSTSDGSGAKFATAAAAKAAYDHASAALSVANSKANTAGTYGGLRAQATTKADVGLSAVPNWGATSSVTDGSSTKFATAAAAKTAYDRGSTALARAEAAVHGVRIGAESYQSFPGGASASIDHKAGAGYFVSGIRIRRESDGDHEVRGMFKRLLQQRTYGGGWVLASDST